MSHYSSTPRNDYAVMHHAGVANSHEVYDDRYCESGYDFTIDRAGNIYVCRNNDDTFYRWEHTPPDGAAWHASGCDCDAIGIMMHGCFGGCGSGDVSGPSERQECSFAFLLSHLEVADLASRLRPHRYCAPENPCNHADPTFTVCPGDNFTAASSDYWNNSGRTLRDRIRQRRRNWDEHNCCHHPSTGRCPQ